MGTSVQNEDRNLPLKKSSCRQSGELCSNRPEIATPAQKINVDNKNRYCYRNVYDVRLIDASIC